MSNEWSAVEFLSFLFSRFFSRSLPVSLSAAPMRFITSGLYKQK